MQNSDPPIFESVVLAGGGNRGVWHAGFWREVQGPLAPAPRQIAAVSAAGAIAGAITAGKGEEALRLFRAAAAAYSFDKRVRQVVHPTTARADFG